MIRFLLTHRLATTVLLLLLTAAAAFSAAQLRVSPGVEGLVLADGPVHSGLERLRDLFGAEAAVLVAIHTDDLFTPSTLERLDELTREAASLPGVARVLSPTNARDIDGDEFGPYPLVPYDEVRQGNWTAAELGERLAAHPLFGGLLVASDARTAGILVEAAPAASDGGDGAGAAGIEQDDRSSRELVDGLRELAAAAARDLPGAEVHVAGLPVERVDVPDAIAGDQAILVPLVVFLMAVSLAILYRHPLGLAVPLSVMLMSLAWTLGLFVATGRTLNPISSLLPPVIMVVSLAGAVHVFNAALAARAARFSPGEVIFEAVRRTWLPCFNAALTTAIGFASLALIPIPALRDFGVIAALGILLSWVAAVVGVPLALSWLPDMPLRLQRSARPGRLEAGLRHLVLGVGRRPGLAALLAVIAFTVAAAGWSRIRIETDIIEALRPGHPLRRATLFIDEKLTGVNSVEILVDDLDPWNPGDLARLDGFVRRIGELDGVRKVLGLPQIVARLNRGLHGGDDGFAKVPTGPEAGADLEEIRELLAEEASGEQSRFLSADGLTSRLVARVTALDTSAARILLAEVKEAAREAGLPDITVTGGFAALTEMAQTLVANQLRGLVPALILILAALVVQLRSLRLGLLCGVPSLAAVGVMYGLMGWAGIPLSVPTAMIAGVAIGLTVDSSIHLMARFRHALAAEGDPLKALAAMIDGTGRSVVFGSITLALGFAAGVAGSFLPTIHFALLTAVALLLGLAWVLVLLPLLLVATTTKGNRAGTGPVLTRTLFVVGVSAITGSIAVPMANALPAEGRDSEAPFSYVIPVTSTGASPFHGQETETSSPASTPPPSARAPESSSVATIVLQDQFGKEDGPGQRRGRVTLLLHGGPDDLRRIKAWETRLIPKGSEGPGVLRVIDVRELDGKRTDEEVRERLRERVPMDISILVDWEGQIAQAYDLIPGEISTTILDAGGQPCATEPGRVNDEAAARLRVLLDSLESSGSCPQM